MRAWSAVLTGGAAPSGGERGRFHTDNVSYRNLVNHYRLSLSAYHGRLRGYLIGIMMVPTEAPRRRRSIAADRLTRQMRVSLPVELDDRLRALGDKYEVAAGTIARAAIEAGLRAVTEQLRPRGTGQRTRRRCPRTPGGGRMTDTERLATPGWRPWPLAPTWRRTVMTAECGTPRRPRLELAR